MSAQNINLPAQPRTLWPLVCALGVTQIISWGQLYYAIAVLWPQISADLGLTRTMVFGIVSLTLLVNGLVAPFAGRAIDRFGGRRVMSLGSVVAAAAFAILASAQNPTVYLLGWLVGGLAMSMTMYDPAFATLSQHSGDRYRRSMTMVTLFGGLASTTFWPLTAWLQTGFGWRGTFLAFTAMQLGICLLLHLLVIPRARVGVDGKSGAPAARPAPVANAKQARTYRWLTASFCLHAFIMSVMAVHLLALLQSRGLTLGEAITVGMFIGPSQVFGRLIDLTLGGRFRGSAIGTISLGLITMGMCLLILPNITLELGFVIAMFWGSGTGLVTIAKGICVDDIFGREDYGAWMGRIGRWIFSTHAIAPAGFALLLTLGLDYADAGWLFAALSIAALFCFKRAFADR